ncbi:MAG: undecaprenyl-diphosphate phosphatase [Lachnospiraceae bacterium]
MKYSFIMAIPVDFGSSMPGDWTGIFQQNQSVTVFYLSAGAVTAEVVGYFSCRKMLTIVRKKKFRGFAIYCLILGSISIIGYVVMR